MDEKVVSPAAPGGVTELLVRLEDHADDLPKRLRQCAQFTRRHLHLIAVSTVSEMARASDVAPSVYIRFCQALGFSGYTEMQSLFRAQYTEFRPNYFDRLAQLQAKGEVGSDALLADFAEAGHKSLLSLVNTPTKDGLARIAEGMASARVVHLIGLRRAYSIVNSMAYLFDQFNVPTMLHFSTGMLRTDHAIFPEDVLFAVTYAPFSEETVAFAESISRRGITVYGLSDTERCPLTEFADEVLIAREDEVAGFRALNASITLATALAVSVKAMCDQS